MPVLGQGISPTLTIYVAHAAHDIVAVGTIFNIFKLNLSPPRRRASALGVEPRSRVEDGDTLFIIILVFISNGLAVE